MIAILSAPGGASAPVAGPTPHPPPPAAPPAPPPPPPPLLCHLGLCSTEKYVTQGVEQHGFYIPGILMVWLQPHFRRTIGVIVVTGDVFKRPVSFRTVRLTYMRSSHAASELYTREIQLNPW